MADKHYRSLIKAVSWRLTGRIKWALTISGVELFTKVGLYYAHERIWDKLPFGRIPEPAKGKGSFEIGWFKNVIENKML